MNWLKRTDTKHVVTLVPKLARLFWSERVVDVGMKVTLTVETEWVNDGTKLKLSVHDDAKCESKALLQETVTVKESAAALEDWEVKVPDPVAPPEELYFKVVCDKPALAAISPGVPLQPLVISS